jgi:hypothetical protein
MKFKPKLPDVCPKLKEIDPEELERLIERCCEDDDIEKEENKK